MIFYKLDYVIEAEQAREREAAMCATHAKPREAAAGETWTKLTGALKSAAREYFAHQGWKAHEGVFATAPLGAQGTGVRFAPVFAPSVNHARELKKLAGVNLSRREAVIVWERLLEHKWYLGERLGRDVGMRVAAADFFENVEQPRERSKPRKAWEPLPRLPMMMPFGERG